MNPVNCVGVMGKGLALQFKRAFPGNFEAYVSACMSGDVRLGRMFTCETGSLTVPRFVVNFPTKHHWRDRSALKDIDNGLRHLVAVIKELNIRSLAVPALGCGLGGLSWREVKQSILRELGGLQDVEVTVYEPTDLTIWL